MNLRVEHLLRELDAAARIRLIYPKIIRLKSMDLVCVVHEKMHWQAYVNVAMDFWLR